MIIANLNESVSNSPSCDEFPKWMFWKKRRYVVAIFAFFGFFNVFALRAIWSIAIIAMTEKKTVLLENNTVIFTKPEFDWDSKTQGFVLSSFFWGYITTQIFAGWLSAKIGGKKVFAVGIGVTGLLTILTPVVTQNSVYLLLAVRIIQGVFEGVSFPSIYALWSKWAPPLERTKLLTIGFSGNYVGTLVTTSASAYLATTLGWSSIFYVFGAISIVWVGFWWYFVAESPADDPRISKFELEYIQAALKNVKAKRNRKHPWKKILTSLPVWAIIVSHFTEAWGFYILLTQLPKFMKDMFNYDLGKSGFLSSLPYLAMTIAIQFSGQLADWVQEKKILSTTNVRKIFNSGGSILKTIFLVVAVHLQSAAGTVVTLVLADGFGVFSWSGFGANYLDIAPQHASIIMGVSNTFVTIAAICSPILAGYIVTTSAREEWQILFCITGGVLFFGTIVYGVFASGEVQDWAIEKETKVSTCDNTAFETSNIT